MDWTAVGAVGEVFGATAVFATLLHLSPGAHREQAS